MTGIPRGRALIINNSQFSDGSKRRIGSQADIENLENLLTQLGFEVTLTLGYF
jgi:hypothetical protein